MSSLDQDDADKRLQQAVPWVSDPQQREQETRRLQEDVIEAAKRLEHESAKFPSPPFAEPQTAVGFRLAESRLREDRTSSEDRARKIWAQLKPEFMSPPPHAGLGVPSPHVAMAAGFLGAMAVSAIVALVVVNVVHHPTIGADVSGEERAAKGHSLATTTLGDLARISEAQAKMTHDEAAAPAETVLAAAAPSEVAAPKDPASPDPTQAKLEPARPELATPATNPVPTKNAVPDLRSVSPLSPDEAASLMKRGRDLIAAGDIASARLVLTLVAEAGDAQAALALASTFDPVALANMRAVGVQGDPAKARAWYARAAELGSYEARQRLQALR